MKYPLEPKVNDQTKTKTCFLSSKTPMFFVNFLFKKTWLWPNFSIIHPCSPNLIHPKAGHGLHVPPKQRNVSQWQEGVSNAGSWKTPVISIDLFRKNANEWLNQQNKHLQNTVTSKTRPIFSDLKILSSNHSSRESNIQHTGKAFECICCHERQDKFEVNHVFSKEIRTGLPVP